MPDYDYAPVMDEEDEKDKDSPYPPAVPPVRNPAAPASLGATSNAPLSDTLGPEPVAPPAPDYLGSTGASRMAMVRPAPKASDYAVPEPHGASKFGHFAASINPITNEFFNKQPAARAENAYAAATKEHAADFADQEAIAKQGDVENKEKSEANLRGAQADFYKDRLPTQLEIEQNKENAGQKKVETQGDTARDVAGMKAQNQRAQIKVMGDGTYEELEKGKWTRIGDAPPRTEPGNYVPVPSDDGTGATVGWINPKSHHFVGVGEIGGAASVAPGGAIPAKPSGATVSRQNQASAIDRASDGLIKTITTHRDKVGNVESIIKSAFLGTPLADPDLAGIATELSSYAALQPALHGFKGQDALHEFIKIIGGIPKDADALIASIKAIQKTAGYVNPAIAKNKSATGDTGEKQAPPKNAREYLDRLKKKKGS